MKKIWSKIKNWFSAHKPSKRRIIQLYAALLFNANIKGFVKGSIYTGPLKNICSPGLNCYSCPGASGACPLGALQNSLVSSNKRLPYYMFGIILLYGIIAGRWICSFLCPFGLIQELLHKIKTPKLKKNRVTRILSHLKYVILVVFVFIFPLMYMIRNVPLPAFCKYICPAGTLEGAMGLLSNKVNASYFSMLGPIFTWKFILLVAFVTGAIFIFRFFCRFFCPLGALYGLFNKISFFGIKLEKSKCTSCGACINKCKMDVYHVGDRECISCGECMDTCPTGAISWKGSKIFLNTDAVIADGTAPVGSEEYKEKVEQSKKKAEKRNKIIKISVISSMVALLVAALLYFNVFYDPDKGRETPTETPTESEIDDTEGLEYTLDPTSNSYFVTGMGDAKDAEIAIPSEYDGKAVTGIAERAFYGCEGVTTIVIPETVTYIGAQAFGQSEGLTVRCNVFKADKPEGWDANWCDSDVKISWKLPAYGNKEGDLCPEMTLDTYVDGKTFSISETKGKVTVVNFWYTTCTPCVQELPHFNAIANEYSENVAVIAVHAHDEDVDGGEDYINSSIGNNKMIILKDTAKDDYYWKLGGRGTYPMTLVLDSDGIIIARFDKPLSYQELKDAVDRAIAG